MDLDAAAAYHEKHHGQALVVARGEDVLLERYGNGLESSQPHALYSGTKSFWGVLTIAAQEDGLLALDELACETIPWREDARKSRVTLRMLLDLTAGFGFGGLGAAVPEYAKAIDLPLKNDPGSVFTYGGIALQVFGAVLAAKLRASNGGISPQEYLRARVLDPAGVTIARWRSLRDGTQPLPTGAFLTARNWLAYGRYVYRERGRFDACFHGSSANARYGLAWWLALPGVPAPDLVYASGAAGQALYLVPSLDLTVVRFGTSASYKHDALVKRLLTA
jgi:CubicO group peptidase (beta-lactamase class C family)